MGSSTRKDGFRPGLAHRVMGALLRAHAELERGHKQIEALGLAVSEFDFICALGNTRGLRMSQIAKHMITSSPNVTRVANALEARGLVERVRSETSAREVVCRLTKAGERTFAATYARVGTFSERAIKQALDTNEQNQLLSLLEKFTSRIQFGEL